MIFLHWHEIQQIRIALTWQVKGIVVDQNLIHINTVYPPMALCLVGLDTRALGSSLKFGTHGTISN